MQGYQLPLQGYAATAYSLEKIEAIIAPPSAIRSSRVAFTVENLFKDDKSNRLHVVVPSHYGAIPGLPHILKNYINSKDLSAT